MDRKVWAFALVGVAAVLRAGRAAHRRRPDRPRRRGPVPWRARAAERLLLGADAGGALFERAAEAALEGAAPLAHNAYKLPIARALVGRALTALAAG